MNYWSTARRGVLGLSAATIAYSVWKKNPVLPLALYGMHLAEYFIVAKKAGKKCGMTILAALSTPCFTASPSGFR